jgi:hypothetical protein
LNTAIYCKSRVVYTTSGSLHSSYLQHAGDSWPGTPRSRKRKDKKCYGSHLLGHPEWNPGMSLAILQNA